MKPNENGALGNVFQQQSGKTQKKMLPFMRAVNHDVVAFRRGAQAGKVLGPGLSECRPVLGVASIVRLQYHL